MLVSVIVVLLLDPVRIVSDVGFALMVKSGGGPLPVTTVKTIVSGWAIVPEVPTIVMLNGPLGVFEEVASVTVALLFPPDCSVTLVCHVREHPVHRADAKVRVIVPLNPLMLLNIMVEELEAPAWTMTEARLALMVKSGGGLPATTLAVTRTK